MKEFSVQNSKIRSKFQYECHLKRLTLSYDLEIDLSKYERLFLLIENSN